MAPRKANQRQLTKEQIVSATMKLIDEHGLEGHTMRQLGKELGVDPSSIYYYVPSKSELYNLIADEIMGLVDLSIDDKTAQIEDRLVAAAWAYRSALLVHPKALPLVSVRSMRTPAQLRGVEVLVGIFYDAGFSSNEAVVGIDAFGQAAIGMTNAYAAHLSHSEYHDDSVPFGELPADEFPNVIRLLAECSYLGADFEFEQGMRAVARGLISLHESGSLEPTAPDVTSALADTEGVVL